LVDASPIQLSPSQLRETVDFRTLDAPSRQPFGAVGIETRGVSVVVSGDAEATVPHLSQNLPSDRGSSKWIEPRSSPISRSNISLARWACPGEFCRGRNASHLTGAAAIDTPLVDGAATQASKPRSRSLAAQRWTSADVGSPVRTARCLVEANGSRATSAQQPSVASGNWRRHVASAFSGLACSWRSGPPAAAPSVRRCRTKRR